MFVNPAKNDCTDQDAVLGAERVGPRNQVLGIKKLRHCHPMYTLGRNFSLDPQVEREI